MWRISKGRFVSALSTSCVSFVVLFKLFVPPSRRKRNRSRRLLTVRSSGFNDAPSNESFSAVPGSGAKLFRKCNNVMLQRIEYRESSVAKDAAAHWYVNCVRRPNEQVEIKAAAVTSPFLKLYCFGRRTEVAITNRSS